MKKLIVLYLITMVIIYAAGCGQKAAPDTDKNGTMSQDTDSPEEKAPETYYDIAVYTLTDYYERIYTGKEKARFTSELRTDELDSYVEGKISEKQKTLQAAGGYVKDLKLSFSKESGDEAEDKIILTIHAEASFRYTDSAEESGFGVTSVFEFTSQNGKSVITGWKMPDPPNDDFNY